jgi:hypothetical protein
VESLRSVFFKNNNDRIPYFDIRYSLFDIHYSLFQSFFFDLTGRFFWPAAALKPDTSNLQPYTLKPHTLRYALCTMLLSLCPMP